MHEATATNRQPENKLKFNLFTFNVVDDVGVNLRVGRPFGAAAVIVGKG